MVKVLLLGIIPKHAGWSSMIFFFLNAVFTFKYGLNIWKCARSPFFKDIKKIKLLFFLRFIWQIRINCTFSMIELRIFKTKNTKKDIDFFLKKLWRRDRLHDDPHFTNIVVTNCGRITWRLVCENAININSETGQRTFSNIMPNLSG